MRILIDECLPAPIIESLTPFGHECKTVREIGLGSKTNGELLAAADGNWDVLLKKKHEHQIPAKHDRTENLDRDTLREFQSPEGSASTYTCVRTRSSFYPERSSCRDWARG